LNLSSEKLVSSLCFQIQLVPLHPELMCAVRVATANDTEVVLLAGRLTAAEDDAKKKKKRRGEKTATATTTTARQLLRKAVSEESEARALAALHETVAALLDSYPTSNAEDEAALLASSPSSTEEAAEEGGGAWGPASFSAEAVPLEGDAREAVRCRLREKLLLINALNGLQRTASIRLKKRPFDLNTGAGG
jgi:hypothetical protein